MGELNRNIFPFQGDHQQQQFAMVRRGYFDFPPEDWDNISDHAKNFIRCLLQMNPSKRLTASQAMQHEWILEMTTPKAERDLSKCSLARHVSDRSTAFENFLGVQKLKRAVLEHIVSHLTDSEMGNLEEIFQNIDKNNDGFMTLQELDHALAHEYKVSMEMNETLKKLRQVLSTSTDQQLNWKDFLKAMTERSIMMRDDKIKMAFEHFNTSDSHCLHWSDLVVILGGEAEAKEIVADVDTDGDGLISFEEFKALIVY